MCNLAEGVGVTEIRAKTALKQMLAVPSQALFRGEGDLVAGLLSSSTGENYCEINASNAI